MRQKTAQYAMWENFKWVVIGDCTKTLQKLTQLNFKTSGTSLYKIKPKEEKKFCHSYRDERSKSLKIKRIS